MPLFAFVLLAVLCLALLGFACACLADHPMQAIEHALSAIPALPALAEIWASSTLLLLASAWLLAAPLGVRRPSSAVLQRFLL